MVQAIKEHVIIGPGGRIEIESEDLPAGVAAEVIVMIEQPAKELPPLTSFIGAAKGLFGSQQEADAYLRRERDSWDS